MPDSLKVEWSEAIETGHRTTDIQHKVLVDTINELAEAIETKQTGMKLNEILNFLQYYTEWHFEREELCMEASSCPVSEVNKAAHKKFIEKLSQFREEYRQGGSLDLAERMYKEMVDWLVNHIQKVDGQLRHCNVK